MCPPEGLSSSCSSPHERERPRWALHTGPRVSVLLALHPFASLQKNASGRRSHYQGAAAGEAAEQSVRPGLVRPAEASVITAPERQHPLCPRVACYEFSSEDWCPGQRSQRGLGGHPDTRAMGGPHLSVGDAGQACPPALSPGLGTTAKTGVQWSKDWAQEALRA